jgi:hypothetical protein
MALPVLQCAIEKIARWHPELFLEMHIVGCAAVLSRYSASPALFDVECLDLESRWLGRATGLQLELSWSRETEEKAKRLRATIQAKPLVEAAAIALAMVLTREVVPLGTLDVTEYGDRADYRSPTVRRVLEISGTERMADLDRRHRQKVVQAKSNPFGWDAYVIVCAFSSTGHRIRFTGHRHNEVQSAEAED